MAVVALSLAASAGPLFDAFEGMVDDKDVQVRVAVVSSLAEVKTTQARKALEHMLGDAVPEALKSEPGEDLLADISDCAIALSALC